jgi:hypothetical protein
MFESISNFIALEISFGTRCHPNLSITLSLPWIISSILIPLFLSIFHAFILLFLWRGSSQSLVVVRRDCTPS